MVSLYRRKLLIGNLLWTSLEVVLQHWLGSLLPFCDTQRALLRRVALSLFSAFFVFTEPNSKPEPGGIPVFGPQYLFRTLSMYLVFWISTSRLGTPPNTYLAILALSSDFDIQIIRLM